MKASIIRLVAAVALLSLVAGIGLLGTAHQKAVGSMALASARQDPPSFDDLTVDWGLTLDQDQQLLYEEMIAVLGGVTTVPNDRGAFYSALNGQIAGWSGMVTDVTENNGVSIVTVLVAPYLDTPMFNVDGNYSEQYAVDQNNDVTYLGFLDPDNASGLDPSIDIN